VRRLTPVPAKSVEILLLESPEAFSDALLARPPGADQNHLIARDKSETLRRFALRAIRRLRRLLATPDQISGISYLFGGDSADDRVRCRLLRALLSVRRRGSLEVIGPHGSTENILGYLGSFGPSLPEGSRLEAKILPSGWTIMSARDPAATGPLR
jgi:hypothetical protein